VFCVGVSACVFVLRFELCRVPSVDFVVKRLFLFEKSDYFGLIEMLLSF
jgi:hypothetical protein